MARILHPGDALRVLADATAYRSFLNARRTRRFEAFAALVDALLERQAPPIRVLDIGGTNSFWEQRGWAGREDVQIVLINIEAEPRVHPNIEPRPGDATHLREFEDGSFDIVFSNSVIEHLETFTRQAAMAAEVRRLAPTYWIQTPSFWFPPGATLSDAGMALAPSPLARGAAAASPVGLARALPGYRGGREPRWRGAP